MNPEFQKIAEELTASGCDAQVFALLHIVVQLRELNSNLRELDKTLMNLHVRTY